MKLVGSHSRKILTKVDEEPLVDIKFNIFKFNNRPRPNDKNKILIISAFSEFGCEIVGAMYCIPKILRENFGKYIIVMGWYGREYLYRHLVDEFWEIKEEHQWLRDYCRAFHHESINLDKIEEKVSEHGRVIKSKILGNIAVGNICNKCRAFWGDINKVEKCKYCGSPDVEGSIFGNIKKWKPKAIRIPIPSNEKLDLAKTYLKENAVGIFARNRKAYGRNLQPEFYIKLINSLEKRGYNPIWLGEKHNTLPCPVNHIIDFSRTPECRDLELTLAIINQLKFTVQFWTASTRLASMMEVPYILFESPDQIWGNGQEGFRRNLCDFGPSKLVVSHFSNVFNDNDTGIKVFEAALDEVEDGNYNDFFGMLETVNVAQMMKDTNKDRIGTDGR